MFIRKGIQKEETNTSLYIYKHNKHQDQRETFTFELKAIAKGLDEASILYWNSSLLQCSKCVLIYPRHVMSFLKVMFQ